MKKITAYKIVSVGSGVPYGQIGGTFKTVSEAELWAQDTENPVGEEGRTVADAIHGGAYKIIPA